MDTLEGDNSGDFYTVIQGEESKKFFKKLREAAIEKLKAEGDALMAEHFSKRDLTNKDDQAFFLFAYQLGQAHILESLVQSGVTLTRKQTN